MNARPHSSCGLNSLGYIFVDGPYTWYRSLSAATKNNLPNLQAAFNNKYMQHDGLTWARRAELSERKQVPFESVGDYAEW